MSKSDFLFNNQYHEDVVRDLIHELQDMSWARAVEEQKTLCQSEWLSGSASDFVQDEALNKRMKFPEGSYTTFIPKKIVSGYKAKVILDKYIIPKRLISIRDILVSNDFAFNYIFWIAEYVFMDLKICLTHNGTYLVIENKASTGISDEKMQEIIRNYDNEFCENRWCLEIRPRTSWMYTETNQVNLLTGLKIPQSAFTTKKFTIDRHTNKTWRLCITVNTENPNLMRMTNAIYTEDNCLEISEAFNEFLQGGSFNCKVFTYEEPFKSGYTIMPNFEGPTGYLLTVFGEYLVESSGRRLKVLANKTEEDDWVTSDGKDIHFTDEELANAFVMGSTGDINWLSIPCKTGTPPVNPYNFRIWEYDADNDIFGRMNVVNPELIFPNIYTFQIVSEEANFYIEWIREDSLNQKNFLDLTELYRKYIGVEYPVKKMAGELNSVIQDYQPSGISYSDGEFISDPSRSSVNEYHKDKLISLLKNNKYGYHLLYNALARANAPFKINNLKISSNDNWITAIESGASELRFAMSATTATDMCDVFINGKYIHGLRTDDQPWGKYLIIPLTNMSAEDRAAITADSDVTIIRYTTAQKQRNTYAAIDIHEAIAESHNGRQYVLFPYDYKGSELSGADLTLYDSAGLRLDTSKFGFGMYACETLVQYPTKMIDWEGLGIDKNDPNIASRIYTDENTGMEVIVFDSISTNELSYQYIRTDLGEFLLTLDPAYLVVKSGKTFVHCEPGEPFSKKVNPLEIAIEAPTGTDALNRLGIANADVYRRVDKFNMIPIEGQVKINVDLFYGIADPARFLVYVDGKRVDADTYTVTFSPFVAKAATVTINVDHACNVTVMYIPYPIEIHEAFAGGNILNTSQLGIYEFQYTDLIFDSNGKLIPVTAFEKISDQLYRVPNGYTDGEFMIIRQVRDSNFWECADSYNTPDDIITDLIRHDPGFASYMNATE